MLPNTRNYPAKDKHHSELHLIWRKHERDLWAIVGWGGLSFFFSLFSSLCCSTVILRHFLSPWGLFFIRATEWRVTVMTSKLIKRHKITLAPPLRLEKTREQKENIQPSGSFFFSLSLARFHHQIPPFLLFLGFSHFVFCVCVRCRRWGEKEMMGRRERLGAAAISQRWSHGVIVRKRTRWGGESQFRLWHPQRINVGVVGRSRETKQRNETKNTKVNGSIDAILVCSYFMARALRCSRENRINHHHKKNPTTTDRDWPRGL